MEEQWLYEAITGTYLPLLQMFEGLIADGVPYRCTVSLSAPLITMLTDDLLKERYAEHLDNLIELADKEIERTRPEPHYQRLAQMYRDRFQSLRHTWRCHDGNLVQAFRRLQDAGRVEVITSTATHAFFPLMDRNWAAIRAQVHAAADLYEKHFGRRPLGMWLGECGYVPGRRRAAARGGGPLLLRRHARHPVRRSPPGLRRLRAAVLPERRGRVRARHRVVASRCGAPRTATRATRTTATSIATSASTCRWTTSGRTSTPKGTGCTPASSTTPSPTTSCTTSGSTIRTSRAARPACTRRTSAATCEKQARAPARRHMDRPPMIVSPYDAELYGHWWYEGPIFLGDLFRQLHYDQHDDRDHHARRLPGAPPHQPGRDAVRVVVGRSRATTSTG